MPRLRMFAAAAEAAQTSHDEIAGQSVGQVLDAAVARYGPGFAAVLTSCQVWLNGEPAQREAMVHENDTVAVLPPFSGG